MLINYLSRNNPLDKVRTIDEQNAYNRGRIVTKEVDIATINHGTFVQRYAKVDTVIRRTWRKLERLGLLSSTESIPYDSMYTKFRIPKHSGGYRTISTPNDTLKPAQYLVLDGLFKNLGFLPHNAVHSFVPFRNCKTAMEIHQRNHSRWFLKVDIHKYFDNIDITSLMSVILKLHPYAYTQEVNKLKSVLGLCFVNQGLSLPQGAPTSPWISNIYLTLFDHWLTTTLGKEFIYTRYADDIIISSRTNFDYKQIKKLVTEGLGYMNLKLSPKKTRYGSCSGSNWNLGLMYNKDLNVTVGHQKKHLLKTRVHRWMKMDRTSTTFDDERRIIQGLLAYYSYIEPKYFDNLLNKWRTQYQGQFPL